MPGFCACPFPQYCKATGKCWKGYPMGETTMDAPKRIWAWLPSGRRWDDIFSASGSYHPSDRPSPEYILAAEHARIVAEKDAEIARLREACNQSRLAFAGYVSVQSAIDALDRATDPDGWAGWKDTHPTGWRNR